MGTNRLKQGVNDLYSHNPELLEEWDFEKNGDLRPDKIAYGTAKKVWWKCHAGHSFLASPNVRTNAKQGCPVCSGRRVLKGYNDLASVRPDIAEEWDYERNAPFCPEEFLPGSSRKFWWHCGKEGHSWKTSIVHRVSGTGCPFCAGKRIVPGKGSIRDLTPQLMEEWDYEKNTNINPEEISRGSNRKVWWKCKRYGHSWKAVVGSRAIAGNGCPYCGGTRVLKGFNDLETLCPELMEEWNYDKNIGIDPGHLGSKSSEVCWWKCVNGHEWLTSISDRANGNGCPYCSGKMTIRLRLV